MEVFGIHRVGTGLTRHGFIFDHHAPLAVAHIAHGGRSVHEAWVDVFLPNRLWFHLMRVSVDNAKSGTHGFLVPTYLQGDYATVNTGYAQALIWNGMGQVDEIRSTLLQYGTFY